MNKLLSISISAYNKGKYLDQCIQSLLIPSLDKLEIIVVNDGSTDNTSEIAHKYADQYPDSIIAIDKSNGHTGSCVNASLKRATGKYYKLLDADDYFVTENLEKYVAELEHTDADMIITTHVICRKPPVYVKPQNVKIGVVYNQSDMDFHKLGMDACLGLPGVTYKRQILNNIHLKLTEGSAFADAEFSYFPIVACKTVQFFDFVHYMYRVDVEGQQSTIVSVNQKEQAYAVAKRMLDDFINNRSKNIVIRSNQRIVLERTLIAYYGLYLLHFRRNELDNRRIKEMDVLLKAHDEVAYKDLGESHCLELKFVKWHRKTGCTLKHIASLLSSLKRIYKKIG